MNRNRLLALAAGLLLACGFLFFAFIVLPGFTRMASPAPTRASDLLATLSALTPSSTDSPAFPTSSAPTGVAVLPDEPAGRIVFTCQMFKVQAANQICIMNADGSGYRRLTTDNGRQHRYPSLSPDGQSVVYAAFREANVYEIYEMDLSDGLVKQLTDRMGVLSAPEISPDGQSIVFTLGSAVSDKHAIWVMNRDGSSSHEVFDPENSVTGAWDPTWSPDGRRILFASDVGGSNQLWIMDVDGSDLRRVSNLPALRGRSDWSLRDLIVTYSGESWGREIYAMGVDGSNQRQVSPAGGNSQGPSFSPDGGRVAFTAYFDKFYDIHGCEIYIMRVDGSDLRRLTDNDYCDYQPRWGP